MIFYILLTTILIAIDQFSKYLTVQNIELYEIKNVIPKFLSFTYVKNSGAAWNILEGQMLFFYIITSIVIIVIVYYLITEGIEDKIFGVILSIILSETIGNFIDRLLNKYVIDMIKVEFIDFPIFNLADSFLVVGIFSLIIYTIYLERQLKWKD